MRKPQWKPKFIPRNWKHYLLIWLERRPPLIKWSKPRARAVNHYSVLIGKVLMPKERNAAQLVTLVFCVLISTTSPLPLLQAQPRPTQTPAPSPAAAQPSD